MFLMSALYEPPSEFLTPRDVAERIGVTRGTVTRWVRRGLVPGFTIAGTTRVDRNALQSIVRAAAAEAANTDTDEGDIEQ